MAIDRSCVDGIHIFKFLGTLISSRLTWSASNGSRGQEGLAAPSLPEAAGREPRDTERQAALSFVTVLAGHRLRTVQQARSRRMLPNPRERRSGEAVNTVQEITGCARPLLEERGWKTGCTSALKISEDGFYPLDICCLSLCLSVLFFFFKKEEDIFPSALIALNVATHA